MRSSQLVAVIGAVLAASACSDKSGNTSSASGSAPAPVAATPAAPTPKTSDTAKPAPLTFITTNDLATKTTGSQGSWDFTIVDARTRVEYSDQHIDGAINVPAEQTVQLLSKLVPSKDRLLIFYCNGPNCTKSQAGARKALAAGYSNVLEYNEGMPAWEQAKLKTLGTRLPQFDTPPLAASELTELVKTNKISILDVRIAEEFAKFRIAGSINVPLDEIEARIKEVPTGPICIVDHSGHQTSIAGRLLASLGRKDLKRLDGGLLAWQRASLPVETTGAARQ